MLYKLPQRTHVIRLFAFFNWKHLTDLQKAIFLVRA